MYRRRSFFVPLSFRWQFTHLLFLSRLIASVMQPICVALGSSHCFVLDTNGASQCFGSNESGQLALEYQMCYPDPTTSPVLPKKLRSVACGSHHTLFTDHEDFAWAVGDGGDGRLGNNNAAIQNQPEKIQNIDTTRDISAGWRHSAVIDSSGILWMFGNNGNGQLGTGDLAPRGTPTLIMEIDQAYQVACGGKHTAVVDCYGNLWSFGDNIQGQLGLPDSQSYHKPTWVSHVSSVRFVSCGWEHTAVIDTNNNLWCFGSNDDGQLGLHDEEMVKPSINRPVVVMENVKIVSCGSSHTIAITLEGKVFATGSNEEGQCGLSESKCYRTFTPVPLPLCTDVSCNQASIVVDVEACLWGFGSNCSGELGPIPTEFDPNSGDVVLRPPLKIPNIEIFAPYKMTKSSRHKGAGKQSKKNKNVGDTNL